MFHLIAQLKVLFRFIVNSTFEYSTVLWGPNTAITRCMIERIQRKCFRHAACKLHISHLSYNYSSVLRFVILNCGSLASPEQVFNFKQTFYHLESTVLNAISCLFQYPLPPNPFLCPFLYTSFLI